MSDPTPSPAWSVPRLRRRDAVVAGHTGDADTAWRAWGCEDPDVRASALGALKRTGALGEEVLLAAFGDPSPKVRVRAAALCIECPGISPASLLDDPSEDVVEAAAWACGERGAAACDAVAPLAELAAHHASPLVREAAVAALGAIGHPEGLNAILGATTDRAAVRRRAVLALAPFDGPEVEAAIRRALGDRDWQTRDAAELLASPQQHELTP